MPPKTRADFINRFKNHINIGGMNHVAYPDASCISRIVYQQPYCTQLFDHEMFYFDMQY